jgi:hypothetical protein
MKKIVTILLVLLSFTSFSQEYWRNYELEKELLVQINNHRDSIGANTLVYDDVNTTALMWANVLIEKTIETGSNRLKHCSCHPGGENLFNMNASYNTHTKKFRNIEDENFNSNAAKHILTSWLNSPLHKEVLEYSDEYLSWVPTMVRHKVVIYMYKVEGEYGGVRILVVYQNRHSSEYYAEMGWDEESK